MSERDLRLKRYLLGMLGGSAPPRLEPAEWAALATMASQHRLGPLLAWRISEAGGGWDVPQSVASEWTNSRHASAMTSLGQQAALRGAAHVLGAGQVGFAVLKGPRLAWQCYPEHGLRPMRDIDVLVAPSDVRRAAELLVGAGFAETADASSVAEALDRHQHLPPMWHAGHGVWLELHHRITDPPGRYAYRVPQLAAEDVLARCEQVRLGSFAVPCPAPADLLAHLIVHALYGHRLDCGPLILADIHFLLARTKVDGAALMRTAREQGWERGAAVLLALTERYFGPLGGLAFDTPPEPILAAAEHALLQDFDKREHTNLLAEMLAPRSGQALAGALAKRLRPERHVVHEAGGEKAPLAFRLSWMARRAGRLLRRLVDVRAMAEGRRAAALLRWLQE